MTQVEISKDEILEVYPKVAETIADALGCEPEEVELDISLIDDLDAESIDFLDLVFRLERTFGTKIPRGKIVEDARGDMPESERASAETLSLPIYPELREEEQEYVIAKIKEFYAR